MEPSITDSQNNPRVLAPELTRRSFLKWAALRGACSGIAVGLYATQIEPHWVEVVRRDMAIAHLPASLEGRTLVQISDVHIGDVVDGSFLIDWFQRVTTWNPDIVVFTGDFLTLHDDQSLPVKQMETVLSHFPEGRLATIGILGNHDYGINFHDKDAADVVVRIAEGNSKLDIVRNETRDVAGLQIVGFDDYMGTNFSGAKVLMKSVDLDRPTLTLCHNPDVVDLPIWSGYRGWILSGHTHGGQCKVPFFAPPMLPISNKRYAAGEILIADGRRLYVNRALGHSMKVRFNVRPEITIFRLKKEDTDKVS